jgi:hypothetical protein
MTHAHAETVDSRVTSAIVELQRLIKQQHPSATFDVTLGEDPDRTYVWTNVDTDDPDMVLDCVVDRLLELQIDEGLPIYVIPIRTPERVRADLTAAVTGQDH